MDSQEPSKLVLASRNRPVHAARRDACVERATEMLNTAMTPDDIRERIGRVDRVIELLEEACREAELAGRGGGVAGIESDFTRFLRIILANVRSAEAFLQNQSHLESDDESFLTQFLGIPREQVNLSAMNYQRMSTEVLMGLWQMLGLMQGPYQKLRGLNQDEFDAEAGDRYRLAYEARRGELHA